jgi:glutamate--cysteine ligase catalytic subunit
MRMRCNFQIENGTVKLSLRGAEIRAALEQKENSRGRSDDVGGGCVWHPEWGAWMVEATPKRAYG